MHLYTRLIVALPALAAIVAACADTPPRATSVAECEIGSRCAITGVIHIFRGAPASVAEIETPEGCFAAALNDDDYRQYKRWNGRRITAFGVLYTQPPLGSVVSYELAGRIVAAGICANRPIMFVDSLRDNRD